AARPGAGAPGARPRAHAGGALLRDGRGDRARRLDARVPRRGLDTDKVLRAAIELADEEGLERATFARLAARLGVRAPSLYNHVDGRAELLRLITLRGLRGLGDAIA